MARLHETTFEYHQPTDEQKEDMQLVRDRFAGLAAYLDANLPVSADKTYVLRKLRECAMWANVCITRHDNGEPRQ